MRTGMFALALGLLCLGFLPALPSVGWLLLLVCCALVCLMTRCWPVGLFLLGFCWACWSAQQALDNRLAARLDGRTLWLEGRVVGLPTRTAQGVRFELAGPHSRRAELPKLLQLSWFDGPQVRAGERWRLAVTLQRPAGLLNPHGPDREASLLARRVGATGTVKSGELLAAVSGGWRDQLRQRLVSVDAHGREAALVALVLGDGAALAGTTGKPCRPRARCTCWSFPGNTSVWLLGCSTDWSPGWRAGASGRNVCLGCRGPVAWPWRRRWGMAGWRGGACRCSGPA
ncbi:hypothetical protein PspTeo4_02000 [Pseudomonas sp. Teo4]|nr:hypothetical protein [Pseudomonas sp. Teo4]